MSPSEPGDIPNRSCDIPNRPCDIPNGVMPQNKPRDARTSHAIPEQGIWPLDARFPKVSGVFWMLNPTHMLFIRVLGHVDVQRVAQSLECTPETSQRLQLHARRAVCKNGCAGWNVSDSTGTFGTFERVFLGERAQLQTWSGSVTPGILILFSLGFGCLV